MKRARAFTLVELLVVIALIAVLMGILMPVLHTSRLSALRIKCLGNMRNMEMAHWMYMMDCDGYLVDVGLGHGGTHAKEKVAWINTLQPYYRDKLLHRCPVDKSPHWPIEEGGQGIPIPPTTDHFRKTSYGINNYLSAVAPEKRYRKLSDVAKPSSTVHFLIMAFEGQFAGADHPHVETWCVPGQPHSAPVKAAKQIQTDAHGGKHQSWQARSNYGFLDGHAEVRMFRDVYTDWKYNSFDPEAAN
jgi:prepilin-type N-terminal cleavage/methylation domain-containing protein/prepilin-type processing-associated H-X9-DG protein